MKHWLCEEHKFIGHVIIQKERLNAIIVLKTDLHLQIFLPTSDIFLRDNSFSLKDPFRVEGQLQDWNIKTGDFPVKHVFQPLKADLELNLKESNVFEEDDYNKPWSEITYFPNYIYFCKKQSSITIPDEWGITFYPEKYNTTLFKFFNNNSRNPRRMPTIFCQSDRSLYFSNKEQWTLSAIKERLEIITSCFSLFTGAPLSYEILIGRYKKDVIFLQFQFINNANAFTCPSQFNGHADIKQNFNATFASDFTKKIEDIFNSPNREKILKLFSYYRVLFMTLYDEVKIAFSFQLMEALARYKEIKIKNSSNNSSIKKLSKKLCKNCCSLINVELKPETDDFDEYIERALDTINRDLNNAFSINPDEVKEVARKYRNQVFHGNFFEDMGEIDNIINRLPPHHKDDLPVLLQAIVSVIGSNFILGIDFSQLTAVKRSIY